MKFWSGLLAATFLLYAHRASSANVGISCVGSLYRGGRWFQYQSQSVGEVFSAAACPLAPAYRHRI